MHIYDKIISNLSALEIEEIVNLCNISKEKENDDINFRLMINKYKNRNNSFVLLMRNETLKLIGCCFILSAKQSNFVTHTEELLTYVKSRYSLDEIFIPSLFYIHPDFRGKGNAKQLRIAYLNKAKEAGYNYALGFGYFSNNIHSFYKYIANIDAHKTELKDPDDRNIGIIPI